MAKIVRYGVFEVQGKCRICEHEGKTHVHHIISQAKTDRLTPGEHNFDTNLKKNLGNMVELCVRCHDQTSHSIYRRTRMLEKELNQKNKGESRGSRRRRSRRTGNRCIGLKKNGDRCGQKNQEIPEGGYCWNHYDQALPGHPQFSGPDYMNSPPPELYDEENFLDDEKIAALQDLHQIGGKPGNYELNLFSEWSEAWQRRWLYREKW